MMMFPTITKNLAAKATKITQNVNWSHAINPCEFFSKLPNVQYQKVPYKKIKKVFLNTILTLCEATKSKWIVHSNKEIIVIS